MCYYLIMKMYHFAFDDLLMSLITVSGDFITNSCWSKWPSRIFLLFIKKNPTSWLKVRNSQLIPRRLVFFKDSVLKSLLRYADFSLFLLLASPSYLSVKPRRGSNILWQLCHVLTVTWKRQCDACEKFWSVSLIQLKVQNRFQRRLYFFFFFNYTFCPYEFLVFCRSKPPESVTEMNVVICTFRFHDIFLTLVCLFCARLSYRWLMFLKYFRFLPERLSLFSDLYTDISIMTQYHLGSWQKL